MIKEYFCKNPREIMSLLSREQSESPDIEQTVETIISTVRQGGDRALRDYNLYFDSAYTPALEVTEEELANALAKVDPNFYTIMEEAADNIRAFHSRQKNSGFILTEKAGVVLGQKVTPLDKVGIYIPGGTALYPSSVLMNAIPAKIAGVSEIVMVSPPNKDGTIDSNILGAAVIAGVDRIFKVGGAQAIAALAYGTESIPKVDKITGPGNIYVATAKKQVFGVVDIDMIAGPSEILIIADDTANPKYVVMDLLAQAEHDKLAASFLVTTSATLAEEVKKLLPVFISQLSRKEIAEHSIRHNGAIILTDTLETAVEISNEIAPEHLEVCTREPFALLPSIRHAGSIFLGHYCPEALGDYFAGPNHTLPTSGTARFSSGLSVDDFVKKSSFSYYTKEALLEVADKVNLFALKEGLEAHGKSVLIRKEESGE